MEARAEHQTRQRYKLLYGITTVLGVVLAVLVLFWCIYFRGGFAWQSTPSLEFNWHPLLMVFGMICIYSQSILIFRTGSSAPRKPLKLVHMILNLTAFILAVIGIVAVFDSHNLAEPALPNLYTLHSWIGLTTVIFFAAQWLGGFTAFLFPGFPKELRAAILPVHVSSGTVIFFFAVVSAVTGMMEKAIFAIKDYAQRPPEAYLMNIMGLILVCFAALVLYLVNAPEYKRTALPEDEIALGNHNE